MGEPYVEMTEDFGFGAEAELIIKEFGGTLSREVAEALPFKGRGLSDRAVETLLACGIDAPERLLFMTKNQIESIPEAGGALLAAILAYRAKFIRPADQDRGGASPG